jgi:hypothetical protein
MQFLGLQTTVCRYPAHHKSCPKEGTLGKDFESASNLTRMAEALALSSLALSQKECPYFQRWVQTRHFEVLSMPDPPRSVPPPP